MTRPTGFDDQLREWIRDVPAAHPNLGVTILEATREMTQERRRWWAWAPARTSFVAAAVVVTLIGGIALLGLVLGDDGPFPGPGSTASPSPVATAGSSLEATARPPALPPTADSRQAFRDTLGTLDTEPVGPGLELVLGDGAGTRLVDWSAAATDLEGTWLRPAVGPDVADDGSVWIAGYPPAGSIRLGRLGAETRAALDTALDQNDEGLWLRGDGSGGVWVGGANDLTHFDGSSWYWPPNDFVADVHVVEVAPDGSAWLVWTHDDGRTRARLAQVDRTAWRDHESDIADTLAVEPGRLRFRDVAAGSDIVRVIVEVLGDDDGRPGRTAVLERRSNGWTQIDQDLDRSSARALAVTIAPDGALWTLAQADDDELPTRWLMRETAEGITVEAEGADVPTPGGDDDSDPPRDRLQVGSDGSVWIQTDADTLMSWNGTAWSTRSEQPLDAFDLAPDATALVLDREGRIVLLEPDSETYARSSGVSTDANESALAALGLPVDAVLEQLEPGVHRILSDGVREPIYAASSQERDALHSLIIIAGRDGSVWSLGPEQYYRLGDERTYRWDESSPSYGELPAVGEAPRHSAGQVIRPGSHDDVEVHVDGTMWYALGLPAPWDYDGEWKYGLWRFDGEAWTPSGPPGTVVGTEILADGSVLARWTIQEDDGSSRSEVRRSSDAGGTWSTVAGAPPWVKPEDARVGWGLHASDLDDVWLVDGLAFRLVDGWWEEVALPDLGAETVQFGLGDDGTVWLTHLVSGDDPGADRLWRLDDGTWVDVEQDQIPERGVARWHFPPKVGPEGALWLPLKGDRECGGIGRFDGRLWQTFLPGTCIYAFDVDAEGRAWIHGGAIQWNAVADDLLVVRDVATYVVEPKSTEDEA